MPVLEKSPSQETPTGKEMGVLGESPNQETPTGKEMEVLDKHLKEVGLNREAIEVVQEMETFHSNVKLEDMIKIRGNLYGCKKGPILFDMYRRLIAELPFIEKVWDA
jgi:hypothetical protein